MPWNGQLTVDEGVFRFANRVLAGALDNINPDVRSYAPAACASRNRRIRSSASSS